MRSMRLLKEPLLHFAVMGGLMFAAYSALGTARQEDQPQPVIRMTATDAEWLTGMWTRQWHRPPTDEELSGLVADHLKEEVLVREAQALELDVGDTIVRRRLAQKMAFLLEDTIRTAEPPEAELHVLYGGRPDLVNTPARVSFTQVFFRREHGDARARASLVALFDAAATPGEEGDPLLLGHTFADQDEPALANLFGAPFAQAVLALPVGRWSGPIESGYGLHLVKVTAALPPQARPFADVREQLAEEWRRARRETAQAQLLQDLIRKYQVVVDSSVRPWLRPFASQADVRP
jgi:PPIC-type PPIASE domain